MKGHNWGKDVSNPHRVFCLACGIPAPKASGIADESFCSDAQSEAAFVGAAKAGGVDRSSFVKGCGCERYTERVTPSMVAVQGQAFAVSTIPVITPHFAMGVLEQASADGGGLSRNVYERLKAVLAREDQRTRQYLMDAATAGNAQKLLVLPPLCHGQMERTPGTHWRCGQCAESIGDVVVRAAAARGVRMEAAGDGSFAEVPMPRSTP